MAQQTSREEEELLGICPGRDARPITAGNSLPELIFADE
jgi:hypothetical protein